MTTKENRVIRDDDDDAPIQPRTQALEPAATSEAPLTRRRRRPKPSGGGVYPGMRQVTAYVEPPLFKWLKSISAETDKPMVLIMEEALTAYVQSFAAGRKFGG
jgi:hypothetical protein